MKNLKIIIPTILILLVGIIVLVLGMTKDEGKELSKTTKKKDDVYTTVIISINPKLALELDKNRKVLNMYPLNNDAKEFNRDEYKSLSIESAIEKVMEDAKDYLDDNKKITVSVTVNNTIEVTDIERIVLNKNKEIKVEEEKLTTEEIKNIEKEVEKIKEDDEDTTTSTTTSTTTTTTTEESTTTTTKKKTTTTKKPEYNLNDNIKVQVTQGDLLGIFVYPNKEECKGKFPEEITIPEGQTYNTYCENKIPTQKKLTGKGYYCEPVTTGMINEDGITTNKPYMCYWIEDIIPESKVISVVEKVLKKSNAVDLGGGLGGVDEITLDEAACKKFSLECGRW